MKIGRMERAGGGERLGVVVGAADDRVLDLSAAASARATPLPATMQALIEGGAAALAQAYDVRDWALARGDESWIEPEAGVRWQTPVTPRTMICAGRNFGRHKDESLAAWTSQGTTGFHFEFPCGFVQLPHTLVPHRATVVRPQDVRDFDYEVEVAAVIGTPALRVGEGEALRHVFGYTIFNDLSAREWQKQEMRNQMIMLGKNFPGFGPVGPWILTADEVPDPAQLVVSLRVNGETRQHERCTDMIFGFAQLIAFWSKVGLQAGDMIASGTPEGVAQHRKPDPRPFYLKPGDVVHARVDAIGTLETRIA